MRTTRDFPPEPAVLHHVRQFVKETLDGATDPVDAILVASELASNVVRHANTVFTVSVAVEDVVRIEVSDGSAILPAVEELTTSSRGLRVVEATSLRWGADLTDTGKTVWVELPHLPGPASSDQ